MPELAARDQFALELVGLRLAYTTGTISIPNVTQHSQTLTGLAGMLRASLDLGDVEARLGGLTMQVLGDAAGLRLLRPGAPVRVDGEAVHLLLPRTSYVAANTGLLAFSGPLPPGDYVIGSEVIGVSAPEWETPNAAGHYLYPVTRGAWGSQAYARPVSYPPDWTPGEIPREQLGATQSDAVLSGGPLTMVGWPIRVWRNRNGVQTVVYRGEITGISSIGAALTVETQPALDRELLAPPPAFFYPPDLPPTEGWPTAAVRVAPRRWHTATLTVPPMDPVELVTPSTDRVIGVGNWEAGVGLDGPGRPPVVAVPVNAIPPGVVPSGVTIAIGDKWVHCVVAADVHGQDLHIGGHLMPLDEPGYRFFSLVAIGWYLARVVAWGLRWQRGARPLDEGRSVAARADNLRWPGEVFAAERIGGNMQIIEAEGHTATLAEPRVRMECVIAESWLGGYTAEVTPEDAPVVLPPLSGERRREVAASLLGARGLAISWRLDGSRQLIDWRGGGHIMRTITPDQLAAASTLAMGRGGKIGSVTLTWLDHDMTLGVVSTTTAPVGVAIARDLDPSRCLDPRGVEAICEGWASILATYQAHVPMLRITMRDDGSASTYPGEFVQLFDPTLPTPEQTRGEPVTCLVTAVAANWVAGTIQVDALAIGWHSPFRPTWAPVLELAEHQTGTTWTYRASQGSRLRWQALAQGEPIEAIRMASDASGRDNVTITIDGDRVTRVSGSIAWVAGDRITLRDLPPTGASGRWDDDVTRWV